MLGRERLQLQRDRHFPPHTLSARVSSDPGLSVEGIRKRFRTHEVLRGVNLEVQRGEVVALLGRNGAGKTTLLRILVGTIRPDAGRIVIGGYDVRSQSQAARTEISWVLGDEHGWYWRLTGRDNLVFFGMLRGLTRLQAQARAGAELDRQHLRAAADTRVAEYSTGMRARLALARASLVPSSALVLDEPGRGLDAPANEWLSEQLVGLSHTAVLLVTHDLEVVTRVADRSVLLQDGVVRDHFPAGTPPQALAGRIAAAN